MVRLVIVAAVLARGVASGPDLSECDKLAADHPSVIAISHKKPACVEISVPPGQALQVTAEHMNDLALRLGGDNRNVVVDGFEFGTETLTISSSGRYRLEINLRATNLRDVPPTLLMSGTALPLHEAEQWQAAERAATESKHSPSVANIQASLDLWTALQAPSQVARTWLKLGDAVLSSGDLTRAHDAYEKAFAICSHLADQRCVAEAANNSGYAAQQLGDMAGSSARLEEAANAWQKLALHLEQGKTLSNLGIIYSHGGDYQHAISTYDRARNILKPLDPLSYAIVLNNLGLAYLSLAQYGPAKRNFLEASRIENKLPDAKREWIRARLNLGRALMLQDHPQAAKAVMEAALAEAEKRPDRVVRAFALNNLGQVLLRLDFVDDARARLKAALDLHRTLGDKRGEAIALHHLGIIARRQGEFPLARQLLNESLQIRRACGLRDDAADSLFAMAELEFATGNWTQAQSLAEEAVPLLESIRSHVPGPELRASFFARRRNLLDLLVAIAMRPGNKNAVTEGFLAAELGRSRSLLDLLAEREESAPKPQQLLDRRAGIRHEINFLSLMVADESKENQNVKRRLKDLLAEDQEVEARIRESIETREPGARPLASLSALQQDVLSGQSAVLEFQLEDRSSYAWLIRDKQIEVFALPPRKLIESQVSKAAGLFGRFHDRSHDRALQREYVKAMDTLSRSLLGGLSDSDLPPLLILVLDGDLHRVPFAALRLSNGKYFGCAHDLVRAPSSAFLLQASRPVPAMDFPKSILAVYDPVFSMPEPKAAPGLRKGPRTSGPRLARLPFNDELQTITRLVPKSRWGLLHGRDATAPALEKLPLHQYGILHLSTHAMINDEIPELSRIALSVVDRKGRAVDGFLFPYQLANLYLNRSIVVLSACETALGKNVMGEGLIGFSSSLFSAGASQLVLTLSDVDGQASSVFMSKTYSKVLARNPVSMEHAMTLARRSMAKSTQWSDPYFWASFVVVGKPSLGTSNQKLLH
jgi:CHAT domain-containing protein/tetratricopeptide (TPR) repeat protein